jgi:hypothetical protein
VSLLVNPHIHLLICSRGKATTITMLPLRAIPPKSGQPESEWWTFDLLCDTLGEYAKHILELHDRNYVQPMKKASLQQLLTSLGAVAA